MRAYTLQRIGWSGSSSLELACTACGREGEPMRRVRHGDSQLPISQLWRTGKLVCPCGGPGDHLVVCSAPAGMTPRALAQWRWSDVGL